MTGHVGLNVSDLNRSKQFYREVLGFQVAGESQDPHRRFVFLSNGSILVLTLWQQGKGQFDKNHPGPHHLSFQVATIADGKAVEQRLREMNVPFIYDGIGHMLKERHPAAFSLKTRTAFVWRFTPPTARAIIWHHHPARLRVDSFDCR